MTFLFWVGVVLGALYGLVAVVTFVGFTFLERASIWNWIRDAIAGVFWFTLLVLGAALWPLALAMVRRTTTPAPTPQEPTP